MGSRTALVVEDNAILQRLYADLMEEAGFDVDVAASGEAALRSFADRPDLDILIADYNLQGAVNGVTLGYEVTSACPGAKVLIISGDHVPNMPRNFEHLLKPFSAAALLAFAENAMREAH